MKVKGFVKFDKMLLDWVIYLLFNCIFNISLLEFENG